MQKDQASRLTQRNSNRINLISSVPYARMVGHKFEVSAYCKQPLLDALNRLLSIKHTLHILLFPVIQIAYRSLFIQDKTVTLPDLLSNLNTNDMVSSSSLVDGLRKSRRSLLERLVHFFIVALPLSITVGVLFGIKNLIKTILNDIISVLKMICDLCLMYQQDMKFYQSNPKLLPPRRISIDNVVRDGLRYYTQDIVHKKFGIFFFFLRPMLSIIESFLSFVIVAICRRLNPIFVSHSH